MKHLMAIAVAGLMMVGCASKPTPSTPSTTSTTPSVATTMTTQNFVCDAGFDVTVKHLGNNQIELTTSPDVKRAVMTQVASASGERYASNTGLWGNGGSWHQKAGMAYFEYAGINGGEPKSTNCTAN